MKNLKSTTVKEILLDANPGTTLHDCIFECIKLSIDLQEEIKLCHNDSYYIISPDNLLNNISDTKRKFRDKE